MSALGGSLSSGIVRYWSAGDGVVGPDLARPVGYERDVLLEIVRGLTNVEIADELGVSEGRVKTHVGAVLTKLTLRNRVAAVILAYELGLVG